MYIYLYSEIQKSNKNKATNKQTITYARLTFNVKPALVFISGNRLRTAFVVLWYIRLSFQRYVLHAKAMGKSLHFASCDIGLVVL